MKRDTRSQEIKTLIKKWFPKAQVRVRIHKYSLGESITVRTDILGKVNEKTIRRILNGYESIDRDSATGEILAGGNTYLFIGRLD